MACWSAKEIWLLFHANCAAALDTTHRRMSRFLLMVVVDLPKRGEASISYEVVGSYFAHNRRLIRIRHRSENTDIDPVFL